MWSDTQISTSLEMKILQLLRRWGRGCVFSNSDFFSYGPSASVGRCLHSLKVKGIIRPLLRGLYDYPKFSTLLQEALAPDLHQVAMALARKHKWHIQPSGNAALNYWGLSTQVPTRILYFSDGPSRKFSIEGRMLEFKPAKNHIWETLTVSCSFKRLRNWEKLL